MFGEGTIVYYSDMDNANEELNNENNHWTTDISNLSIVKSYLIIPGTILKGENMLVNYNLIVPENLGYDNNSIGSYRVNYSVNGNKRSKTYTPIKIVTPKTPALKVELKSNAFENFGNSMGEYNYWDNLDLMLNINC